MEKYHGYEMIDGATKGSFFYRTAFSPDPAREDLYRDLDLWGMTQAAVAFLKERLGTDIQFFAAAHDDQTDIRHVNAVIIVPGRLSKQDFRRLPKLLREAALANVLQQRQLLTPEETQEMAPPAPATGPVASQERQERLYRSVAAVDDPFRVPPRRSQRVRTAALTRRSGRWTPLPTSVRTAACILPPSVRLAA
jgi:hypothetical protein